MKITKVLAIVAVLLLIIAGLYYYLRPKAALDLIFPEIDQVRKVRIRLESDTARISFDALLHNKSPFKLHIDSLNYTVSLDTTELLDKKQAVNVELQEGEEDTILFTLGLPFKRLQKQIQVLQSQDSTEIHLKIEVVYNTIFGKTRLPVERDILIEVPHPPRFELVKTEYIGRDKKTLLVHAHIKVENPGKLDLKITDLTYKMDVEDLFSVEQASPEKVTIKPGTTQVIVLPIEVEVKKLLKTAFLVLTDNDKVNFRLRMKAMVESDMVDAEKTPFEVAKDGVLELKK